MFAVTSLHGLADPNGDMARAGGPALPSALLSPDGAWLGHEWSRWRTDALDASVDRWLEARGAGRSILELGCATGERAERFARCGHKITAVDIVDHAEAIAVRNGLLRKGRLGEADQPAIDFQRADIRTLPVQIAAQRYDLVHARRLINFIADDALDALFSVVARMLDDDGCFVASFIATGVDPESMQTLSPRGSPPTAPIYPGFVVHRFAAVHRSLRIRGLAITEAFTDRQIEAGFMARAVRP